MLATYPTPINDINDQASYFISSSPELKTPSPPYVLLSGRNNYLFLWGILSVSVDRKGWHGGLFRTGYQEDSVQKNIPKFLDLVPPYQTVKGAQRRL